MKHFSRVAIPVLATLLFGAAWIAPVNAQELAALSVTLKQTYAKTATPYGTFDNQYIDAFTPTTIICPQKGNCMVQIQVSAVFQTLWPFDAVVTAVTIDGQLSNPSPNGPIVLKANYESTEDDSPEASTFTWVQVVTPGTHVVAVQVRANQHTANLKNRTLVISVYN